MEQIRTIAARIREGMELKCMKQADLVKMTGIGKSSISTYLSGEYEPKQKNIYKIAKALDVNEAWLMGFDVSPERSNIEPDTDAHYENILPIDIQRIPVLGEIACGKPIYANEEIESYIAVGTDVQADFCLRAKGDSMINARIEDGDIVFIRRQDMVDNGEIAAVIIGDEATLKRVYYDQAAGQLVLTPENPKYPPLVYTGEQLNDIKILGKALAFQSDVR